MKERVRREGECAREKGERARSRVREYNCKRVSEKECVFVYTAPFHVSLCDNVYECVRARCDDVSV